MRNCFAHTLCSNTARGAVRTRDTPGQKARRRGQERHCLPGNQRLCSRLRNLFSTDTPIAAGQCSIGGPSGRRCFRCAALRDCGPTCNAAFDFHNADLAPDERQVIEEEFRVAKELRVLAATTTLAMGVNTPAEAVIVVGLMHPGDTPYSVAEYKNIVGRAGRLGFAAPMAL